MNPEQPIPRGPAPMQGQCLHSKTGTVLKVSRATSSVPTYLPATVRFYRPKLARDSDPRSFKYWIADRPRYRGDYFPTLQILIQLNRYVVLRNLCQRLRLRAVARSRALGVKLENCLGDRSCRSPALLSDADASLRVLCMYSDGWPKNAKHSYNICKFLHSRGVMDGDRDKGKFYATSSSPTIALRRPRRRKIGRTFLHPSVGAAQPTGGE